ncbi:SRPBCC family protein [Undibacterium sp. Ji22W]|uniref:SRPBCC family protein n=1 Tax=Undibacterium sp. Ji22W TaxID=3413038 RepID=UPI003BF30C1E
MNQPTCTVNVSRKFQATAESVFDAWLDPKQAGRFLFVTPAGVMKKVEIDARVGGKFCIVETRDGVDADHEGEYLEIERPRFLRFSFGGKPFPATYVALTITQDESGSALHLVHEGVWLEYETSVIQGWTGILENLGLVLANR